MSPDTTEPLPPVSLRRWSRGAGFLYWFWTASSGTLLIILFAVVGILCVPFFPAAATRIPQLWAKAVLAASGVRVETHFETPLPEGPVIFVSNHQSIFDIVALFAGLGPHRAFVFVAKKSVFRYPFLGWFITAAKYIAVDRGNHAQAIRSLEQAGEKVRAGTSVMVFAEGTRSPDGSVLPFKKGAFHVAMKAKVPLVPLAIDGALHVTPKRRLYVCPNTIRILVGPMLSLEGVQDDARDEIIRQVRTTVIRLHRRIGGIGGDEGNAIAQAGLSGIAAGNTAGVIR